MSTFERIFGYRSSEVAIKEYADAYRIVDDELWSKYRNSFLNTPDRMTKDQLSQTYSLIEDLVNKGSIKRQAADRVISYLDNHPRIKDREVTNRDNVNRELANCKDKNYTRSSKVDVSEFATAYRLIDHEIYNRYGYSFLKTLDRITKEQLSQAYAIIEDLVNKGSIRRQAADGIFTYLDSHTRKEDREVTNCDNVNREVANCEVKNYTRSSKVDISEFATAYRLIDREICKRYGYSFLNTPDRVPKKQLYQTYSLIEDFVNKGSIRRQAADRVISYLDSNTIIKDREDTTTIGSCTIYARVDREIREALGNIDFSPLRFPQRLTPAALERAYQVTKVLARQRVISRDQEQCIFNHLDCTYMGSLECKDKVKPDDTPQTKVLAWQKVINQDQDQLILNDLGGIYVGSLECKDKVMPNDTPKKTFKELVVTGDVVRFARFIKLYYPIQTNLEYQYIFTPTNRGNFMKWCNHEGIKAVPLFYLSVCVTLTMDQYCDICLYS